MVMVNIDLKMVDFIKVIINMTKNMVLEYISGLKIKNMKVIGNLVNK